jgi:U3 small nucleolar RNA-associated protein 4
MWQEGRPAPLRSEDSFGGAIWQAAMHPDKQRIALACQDGSIRLFALPDLNYQTHIQAHKAAALAVAYSPDGSKIASAGADGVVQIWNVENSQNILKITLERKKVKGKVEESEELSSTRREEIPSVWSILWLSTGEIVTGDSFGGVHFWDPITGTLLYKCVESQGPVLTLAKASDSKYILASGVDPNCLVFENIGVHQWVMTAKKRIHNLDVLSMECYTDNLSGNNHCISAGISGHIKIFKLSRTENKSLTHEKTILPKIFNNIQLVPCKSNIMAVGDHVLQVWRLGSAKKEHPEGKHENQSQSKRKRN